MKTNRLPILFLVIIGVLLASPLSARILDELKVHIEVLEPILTVQHSYPTFDITLEGYRCTLTDGEITLTEHQGCGWFTADEVAVLDWAEADLPIVERIQALLR